MAEAATPPPPSPRALPRLLAAGGIVLALLVATSGVLLWRRAQAPAQGLACAGASTEIATLFSDDQTTAIRLSNPDFSAMRILRTEPAAVLPGLFQSLLSLSNDNARLAYVTADDEMMDNANIWSIDTASPGQPRQLAHIPLGFWVVKPVWSPDDRQLAYLALDPDLAAQHKTELVLWVVQVGGQPRKLGSFPQLKPEDFFGDHAVPLCWAADNRTLIFDLAGPGTPTAEPTTSVSTASQTSTTSSAASAATASAASTASTKASASSAASTAASLTIATAAPAGPPRQLQIDTVTGAAKVVLRPPQPQPPSVGGAPPQPTGGSACGVPVFSQNDPAWRFDVMQAGGDEIGPYGCALTSTAMVLNYYGAFLTPPQLNACLKGGADPIYWSQVPGCANGLVSGGDRLDFSWQALDNVLGAGHPAIIGMLRGQTGMHFVVVTAGGGGNAANYAVTDPWDATTNKTLQTFIDTGYNPTWIVVYSGAGKNCGRLVPPKPAQASLTIQGVADGGVYKTPVHLVIGGDTKLKISASVINLSIQTVPTLTIGSATAAGGATTASAGPAPTAAGGKTSTTATASAKGGATATTSAGGATTSAATRASTAVGGKASTAASTAASSGAKATSSLATTAAATTTVARSAGATSAATAVNRPAQSMPVAGSATISQEGVFQLVTTAQGGATKSVKFTIDRTPPTVQVVWQTPPKQASGSSQAFGPAKLLSPLPTGAQDQGDLPQLPFPARFQVAALDTLSGVKSIEYQLDGGDWQPYSNDVTFHPLVTISAPGPHTLGVRATDLAGNTSDVQTFAFDVLPPPGAVATATPTAAPSATSTPEAATPTAAPTATATPASSPAASPTGTPAPTLALEPASLDFGTVTLGQQGPSQALAIKAGGAVPLVIGQVQLGGDMPGDFAIAQDNCSKATLQPKASCSVLLAFAPTRTGARRAALLIPSNAGPNPVSAPLQGTGAAPQASPSPATPTPPPAKTPTATATPRPALTPTASPLPSATPTATSTPVRTPTVTPTATPTRVPPPPAPVPAPTATPTRAPTATATPLPATATPTATATASPTATPCGAFGNASISGAEDQANGVIRVRWSSSGGCAPYAGTITAQYLQGDTDTTSTATFPISAPSGSLNTPDYCSFGGPSVVYTLNLQDSKRQTAVAETAVECSAARAPTPSATPTPVTPTPGFGM